MAIHRQIVGQVLVAILLGGGGTLVAGCEDGPKQKLRQAKVLLTREEQPEVAANKLEAVLEKRPDHLEAKRLMAKVHRVQGDYAQAENRLLQLWRENGFDREAGRVPGPRKEDRSLIRSELLKLYREWAESVDPKAEPQRYRKLLEKGIDFSDEKSRALEFSTKLAKFYWRRGQDLVEQGRHEEAAEAFGRISDIRTRQEWGRAKEAAKKARRLRMKSFKSKARDRFDDVGRELVSSLEGFSLDDSGDAVRIELTEPIDEMVGDDEESDAKTARRIAFVGLIDKVRRLALAIGGLSEQKKQLTIGTDREKRIVRSRLEFGPDDVQVEEEEVRIEAGLPVEAAVQMAYDFKKAYEREMEALEPGTGGGADAGVNSASSKDRDGGIGRSPR